MRWLLPLIFLPLSVRAATLGSYCYYNEGPGQKTLGKRIQERSVIGSLSKLFTSYWAVAQHGLAKRSVTQFAVSPTSTVDVWDVHITGGRDPFMGLESLQFIAGELNKAGVEKIRNLTFDENFQFLTSARDSVIAQSSLTVDDVTPPVVIRHLRNSLVNLNDGYNDLVRLADQNHGMKLPPIVRLSVHDIQFMDSKQFAPLPMAKNWVYQSAPWGTLLKEMNRNSNNYVASQFFHILGNKKGFDQFLSSRMKMSDKDVRLYNGSGFPETNSKGLKIYNEASCMSVLAVLRNLTEEIRQQGGDGLEDVLSVAGKDAPGEESILTRLYETNETSGAVAGKTGTVNPSISLGGLASTKSGQVYFSFFYNTSGTDRDKTNARVALRRDLVKMVEKFGNKVEFVYQYIPFLPFDDKSTTPNFLVSK